MSAQNNNPAAPLAAFIAGALAGIAVGVLFAPRSGRESREALKQKARSNLDRVQEKMNTKQDDMKQKFNDAADKAKGAVTAVDDTLDDTEQMLRRTGKHAAL